MNSPRLHLNLPHTAANVNNGGPLKSETTHAGLGSYVHKIKGSTPDLTRTTHAEAEKPHTPDEVISEDKVDRRMVRALLQLATCSQVKAAGTEARAADSNALRLPVNAKGRALTEDPVYGFAADYKRAALIRDKARRLRDKVRLVIEAEGEVRAVKYARVQRPDIGTQEGRLAVARYARKFGTRRAAEAFCQDPNDPKSVDRMQRNARNYLTELAKVEGAR
jgi:hypothetical protein